MLPGYLHFDVRRGLSSDMLNASMAALLRDQTSVREALDALGLFENFPLWQMNMSKTGFWDNMFIFT